MTQQQGRTGRTDEGDHITMMRYDQYVSQVRSSDLTQLEESDITPMVLRSLVAGRSFARLPFLRQPHPAGLWRFLLFLFFVVIVVPVAIVVAVVVLTVVDVVA